MWFQLKQENKNRTKKYWVKRERCNTLFYTNPNVKTTIWKILLGRGGARVRGFKIVVSCVKMMLQYQILFESESQSSRPEQTTKKTLLRDVFR